MKPPLLVFLVLCAVSSNVTHYYFPTQPINDICTNYEVQNSLTREETFTKIKAIFASLSPATPNLYKTEEKFSFPITILKSEPISNPII